VSIDLSTIDFKSLTPQQLNELTAKIAEARAEVERENREKTKRDVLALIRERGFGSIDELFGHLAAGGQGRSGRRASASVKYRNTADPSQTWAGRGKHPTWLRDAIAAGADIESFRV
jgi:DNA-binding protein H-NS